MLLKEGRNAPRPLNKREREQQLIFHDPLRSSQSPSFVNVVVVISSLLHLGKIKVAPQPTSQGPRGIGRAIITEGYLLEVGCRQGC